MAKMKSIEINIINKTYPDKKSGKELCVLKDFEFKVSRGEFCCIMGPSGCGKTTLLNLASGLDTDFAGEVFINGKTPSISATPGYMFQSPRLMPWLTVRENIELVVLENNASKIDALLEEMAISDFANAYPQNLSGGMQRRVALARTLINEPQLLLLDEPFLSLDLPIANRLRDSLIRAFLKNNCTVLYITHDLSEAIYLADKIFFMSSRPGSIVLEHKINFKRPRSPDNNKIEKIRMQLKQHYPKLLSGIMPS